MLHCYVGWLIFLAPTNIMELVQVTARGVQHEIILRSPPLLELEEPKEAGFLLLLLLLLLCWLIDWVMHKAN